MNKLINYKAVCRKAPATPGMLNSNKFHWYSKLRWISNHDQQNYEDIIVDEISHLTDEQQGEAIANSLASISNQYSCPKTEDIEFEPIPENSFPQFSLVEIQRYLENIKIRKSTVLGDVLAMAIRGLEKNRMGRGQHTTTYIHTDRHRDSMTDPNLVNMIYK